MAEDQTLERVSRLAGVCQVVAHEGNRYQTAGNRDGRRVELRRAMLEAL